LIGWKQRWRQIQRDAEVVTGVQKTPYSGDAIRESTARLYDLFVRAYHLKDHLKADPGVSVSDADIEDAISTSKALALCADLANTDKHAVLARRPRSGSAPVFGRSKGVSTTDDDGWRLQVKIDHGGQQTDAIQLLRQIIDEWDRLLTAWGLA
jgi:hypothetical protein